MADFGIGLAGGKGGIGKMDWGMEKKREKEGRNCGVEKRIFRCFRKKREEGWRRGRGMGGREDGDEEGFGDLRLAWVEDGGERKTRDYF